MQTCARCNGHEDEPSKHTCLRAYVFRVWFVFFFLRWCFYLKGEQDMHINFQAQQVLLCIYFCAWLRLCSQMNSLACCILHSVCDQTWCGLVYLLCVCSDVRLLLICEGSCCFWVKSVVKSLRNLIAHTGKSVANLDLLVCPCLYPTCLVCFWLCLLCTLLCRVCVLCELLCRCCLVCQWFCAFCL